MLYNTEGQAGEQQQGVFPERSGDTFHCSGLTQALKSLLLSSTVPGSPDTLGMDAGWEVQKAESGVLLSWYFYSLISSMTHSS